MRAWKRRASPSRGPGAASTRKRRARSWRGGGLSKTGRRVGCLLVAAIGLAAAGFLAFKGYVASLAVVDIGEATQEYVRFNQPTPVGEAVDFLQKQKIIKGDATGKYVRLSRMTFTVAAGTYSFQRVHTPGQVVGTLQKPVRNMVRLPEGWWIKRTADRLQEQLVCSATDYVKAANDAAGFSRKTRTGTLEGHLFPDTYDLPPLLGAEEVVQRQLRAFEQKAWPILEAADDPEAALIVASMVETETAKDSERPRVAGVIYNRLKRNMRLEIDATVLYALQKWQVLGPGVVRKVRSPYNTYLNFGLPPGPICSPGVASIKAAVNPEQHDFLYYVARPDRSHFFAKTYEEHRANIRKASKEREAAAKR
ncbi:MAG: endolytic transglycosylase MltG [Fimbriimonadaceae bacterium]|nr:endolytic transglycosylase MltG [Fimbriimonadaceae bacterium]QYK57146.1 MAG: endolytic transglycosylase MltG [Fimbriimonadaceae bacterium]